MGILPAYGIEASAGVKYSAVCVVDLKVGFTLFTGP
jgi:hypothetical protein